MSSDDTVDLTSPKRGREETDNWHDHFDKAYLLNCEVQDLVEIDGREPKNTTTTRTRTTPTKTRTKTTIVSLSVSSSPPTVSSP